MKKILTGALAFLLITSATQAQTKDNSRHHRENREMIASELGLSEMQKAKIKSIHEAQRNELQEMKKSSLSAEEQKIKKEEINKKYREQVQAIYTPVQREQIEKRKKQWKDEGRKTGQKEGKSKNRKPGKSDLKRGDLSKKLQLTPQQEQSMSKLRKDSKIQALSIRKDNKLTEDQKKAGLKELRKKQHEQMTALLTASQVQQMKLLKKEHKHRNTK